jgi:hypothetical protein
MNGYINHNTVLEAVGLCKQKHSNYKTVLFPITMNIAGMDVVYSSKGAINIPSSRNSWGSAKKNIIL